MSRQLHLNAFLMGVGHHEAARRHPLREHYGLPKSVSQYAPVPVAA